MCLCVKRTIAYLDIFILYCLTDDITEGYKKLRKLVMDYLGIAMTTPTSSELGEQSTTGSNLLERDQTLDTVGSIQLARAWSQPSLAESATRAHSQQGTARLQTGGRTSRGGVRNPVVLSPMPLTARGVVVSTNLKHTYESPTLIRQNATCTSVHALFAGKLWSHVL